MDHAVPPQFQLTQADRKELELLRRSVHRTAATEALQRSDRRTVVFYTVAILSTISVIFTLLATLSAD
jgi:hypothetical protein